jgi:hypothetical protein
MIRSALFAALIALAFAGLTAAAVPPKDPHTVSLGVADAVIELGDALGPYKMPASTSSNASQWYTFNAENASNRAAIRVLQAGQPAYTALTIVPRTSRPRIVSLAGSDPDVVVETVKAYGGHAYRVTIPPQTSATLAVELSNAGTPPSLLAWTEPALASHNRQLGIFIAAVAGLIFAAAAIAAGLAVMSGHRAPLWAAITLVLVLLARLAGTGMFDMSLATRVGGPYGPHSSQGSRSLRAHASPTILFLSRCSGRGRNAGSIGA